MGLFNSGNPYDTIKADQALTTSLPEPEGDLLVVAPHREGPGLKRATGYVRGMHHVPKDGSKPPTYAFEMWHEEGEIRFVCYAPDQSEVHDVLSGQYPNASAHEQATPLVWIEPGSSVAGGELEMQLDCVFPTKSLTTEDPFEVHPYGALLPKLSGRADEHAMVQVVFQPITNSWYERGMLGRLQGEGGDGIAESVKKGKSVGEINPEVVESDKDKPASKDISSQRNKVSYRVAIRTLAIGPTDSVAQARATKIGDIFDDYFNHVTGQGFTEKPAKSDELVDHIHAMARRDMPQQSRLKKFLFGEDRVLTVDQLGIVANFPNWEDYPANNLKWAIAKSGGSIPHGAPGTEGSR